MIIQVNTMCCQYWHRLFWCLSSIAEQVKPLPEIKIRINTCLEKDKFSHIRNGTAKIFDNLLDIDWVDWKESQGYAWRKNIRNADLKNTPSNTDWILWIDPDQIFHHNHFNFLYNNLNRFVNCPKMLSIARKDISVEDSNNLIQSYKYRKPITNCVDRLVGLNAEMKRRTLGVGYYQLVSVKTLKDKNINSYCDYKRDSNMWNENTYIFSTKSDTEFRMKTGVIRINRCPPVYHIDHWRGIKRAEYFKIDSL